ncbi:hypothetical protein [Methylophaga sp.]|uniref:hypothetical protein n=1 Tax=Methylophaga sp. TaxID=2024840 RepID=UPI003A92F876
MNLGLQLALGGLRKRKFFPDVEGQGTVSAISPTFNGYPNINLTGIVIDDINLEETSDYLPKTIRADVIGQIRVSGTNLFTGGDIVPELDLDIRIKVCDENDNPFEDLEGAYNPVTESESNIYTDQKGFLHTSIIRWPAGYKIKVWAHGINGSQMRSAYFEKTYPAPLKNPLPSIFIDTVGGDDFNDGKDPFGFPVKGSFNATTKRLVSPGAFTSLDLTAAMTGNETVRYNKIFINANIPTFVDMNGIDDFARETSSSISLTSAADWELYIDLALDSTDTSESSIGQLMEGGVGRTPGIAKNSAGQLRLLGDSTFTSSSYTDDVMRRYSVFYDSVTGYLELRVDGVTEVTWTTPTSSYLSGSKGLGIANYRASFTDSNASRPYTKGRFFEIGVVQGSSYSIYKMNKDTHSGGGLVAYSNTNNLYFYGSGLDWQYLGVPFSGLADILAKISDDEVEIDTDLDYDSANITTSNGPKQSYSFTPNYQNFYKSNTYTMDGFISPIYDYLYEAYSYGGKSTFINAGTGQQLVRMTSSPSAVLGQGIHFKTHGIVFDGEYKNLVFDGSTDSTGNPIDLEMQFFDTDFINSTTPNAFQFGVNGLNKELHVVKFAMINCKLDNIPDSGTPSRKGSVYFSQNLGAWWSFVSSKFISKGDDPTKDHAIYASAPNNKSHALWNDFGGEIGNNYAINANYTAKDLSDAVGQCYVENKISNAYRNAFDASKQNQTFDDQFGDLLLSLGNKSAATQGFILHASQKRLRSAYDDAYVADGDSGSLIRRLTGWNSTPSIVYESKVDNGKMYGPRLVELLESSDHVQATDNIHQRTGTGYALILDGGGEGTTRFIDRNNFFNPNATNGDPFSVNGAPLNLIELNALGDWSNTSIDPGWNDPANGDFGTGPVITEVFSDNFDRSNQVLSTSPNWENREDVGLDVVSNQVRNDVTSVPRSNYATAILSNDQYAKCTVISSGDNVIAYALVRVADDSVSFYGARFSINTNTGEGVIQLQKYLSGTPTLIGSPVALTELTDTNIIEIRATGTTIETYVNGEIKTIDTDSDLTSGFAGIRIFRAPGSTARQDDFSCGDIS